MAKIILGIHGGVSINQHDPSAALIIDGEVVACVEEERLYRIKSPRGLLPILSIKSCLKEAGISMKDVDVIVHPGETYEDAPKRIYSYLVHYFGFCPKIQMINHQLAHLSSAFFHSGFSESMCLSYDAFGDRLSAAFGMGKNGIEIDESRDSQNSLGLFYATMTSFLGYLPAEDEFKVMGLAALGKEEFDLSDFASPVENGYQVNSNFIRSDPPIKSNWEPFYSDELIKICGQPRRIGEKITQRHANIAFATQKTLEKCAVSLVSYMFNKYNCKSLCIAGGIGLNCSANLVISELPFIDKLFVQPAASDRGLALGCAMYVANEYGHKIIPPPHVFLGPTYSEKEYIKALALVGITYERPDNIFEEVARLLSEGKIIGFHQGRSEFGPRALGNRSILADPRSVKMKDEINSRVKFREEYRPFAPAVIEDEASSVFHMDRPSPYMTTAFRVQDNWKNKLGATTHTNGTARVQTVSEKSAPEFYRLLKEFYKITGVPVLLNTSFNIKGQPIVETPLEAISTFSSTGIDALCLGPFLILKAETPRGDPIEKSL